MTKNEAIEILANFRAEGRKLPDDVKTALTKILVEVSTPKHAHWISSTLKIQSGMIVASPIICSSCRAAPNEGSMTHCPHCGAVMDLGIKPRLGKESDDDGQT